MLKILVLFAGMLLFCCNIAMADVVSAATGNRIRLLAEKAAKMASEKPGEYAKEIMTAAQADISAAQIALAAGNEKKTLQMEEHAELQLALAAVKAMEKEQQELTAVRRAELKKLEAQLERYRQGEDN